MSTNAQTKIATDVSTNAESGVPEGWAIGRVGDLIGGGGLFTDGDWVETKDQDPSGGVRLVQLADIGDGYYRNKSQRFLTLAKAQELDCTFLKPGDVLIARMPEPLGRACLFPGDPKPAVTAVDVCIVRPGEGGAENSWILYWINSPEIRKRIEELSRGTTRQRISRQNFGTIDFPIPPVTEQKRVVAKIEELLKQVNASRDRLAKVPKILKRFRQSVLAAACSGRLTEDWRDKYPDVEPAQVLIKKIGEHRRESGARPAKPDESDLDVPDFPQLPESWTWERFGVLLGELRNGISVRPEQEPPGHPILRISSVRPGKVLLDDRRYLPNSEELVETYRLRNGDLLFTRYNGSLDLLGVCGLVRGLGIEIMLYPDKLMRVRFDLLSSCPNSLRSTLDQLLAAIALQKSLSLRQDSKAYQVQTSRLSPVLCLLLKSNTRSFAGLKPSSNSPT